MLNKIEVLKSLEQLIGQTIQKDFMDTLISLLNTLGNSGFHVNRVELKPKELDPYYLVLELGASFSNKTVLLGTSYSEFYIHDSENKFLFMASGYREPEKAYTLLNAFMLDYFAGNPYIRNVLKPNQKIEQSTHATLIEAIRSHICYFNFAVQSTADVIILSKEMRIVITHFPAEQYKKERFEIRAEMLNQQQKFMLQDLVDYVNRPLATRNYEVKLEWIDQINAA